MRTIGTSEAPPVGLEELLNDLGAGDSRFSGTSFGRGERDLRTYLQECIDVEKGINIPEGLAQQSTFWLIDDSDEAVGIVRIRRRLDERIFQFGGHIGYYVKSSERGNGYEKWRCNWV